MFILVQEHDTGPGMEYNATCYPGEGFYWNPRMQMYYAVHRGLTYAAGFGGQIHKSGEPEQTKVTSISMSDVTKLLATALHSSAAVALISKED